MSLSVLVLEVISISIRLDGESEEVEARVVGDEDGVKTVPPVVSICYLANNTNFKSSDNLSTSYRVLKINPGVSSPREPTGPDSTEPHDLWSSGRSRYYYKVSSQ